MVIDGQTTALELAALVSQTLEAAGIEATLSGGGAVSVYTDNHYQSADLDFVTAAGRNELATAMAPLGFVLAGDLRHFEHPNTEFYLEFPRAPLAFGRRVLQHDDMPRLDTPWGPLRVITPTFCVMDRLAAFWHWNDRQSWDQAVMVVRSSTIHVEDLKTFAAGEGANPSDIDKLLSQAAAGGYP